MSRLTGAAHNSTVKSVIGAAGDRKFSGMDKILEPFSDKNIACRYFLPSQGVADDICNFTGFPGELFPDQIIIIAFSGADDHAVFQDAQRGIFFPQLLPLL